MGCNQSLGLNGLGKNCCHTMMMTRTNSNNDELVFCLMVFIPHTIFILHHHHHHHHNHNYIWKSGAPGLGWFCIPFLPVDAGGDHHSNNLLSPNPNHIIIIIIMIPLGGNNEDDFNTDPSLLPSSS